MRWNRVLGLVCLVFVTGGISGCGPGSASPFEAAAAGVAGGQVLRIGAGSTFVRCIYMVERAPPRTDTAVRTGLPPTPGQGGPLPGISI